MLAAPGTYNSKDYAKGSHTRLDLNTVLQASPTQTSGHGAVGKRFQKNEKEGTSLLRTKCKLGLSAHKE